MLAKAAMTSKLPVSVGTAEKKPIMSIPACGVPLSVFDARPYTAEGAPNSFRPLLAVDFTFTPPPPLAPEPSAIIMWCVLSTLLFGWWWRRRRKS